jgi:DNA-binding response OmpR family regulator
MTLLSAISMLREDLPIIVITHDDEKHVEALAWANGATACFSKPVSTTQLVVAIREFCSAETGTCPCLTRKIDNANDEGQRFSCTK